MKEHLPNGPLKNTHDLDAVRMTLGIEQEITDTHPRFNLVINRDVARDVVDGEIEDGAMRLLIVHEDDPSEGAGEAIEAAGIPHLERLKVVDTIAHRGSDGDESGKAGPGERFTVYMVPSNAKRMSNERLFPGRPSTETYVSDSELFRNLGALWRNIADATGKLPADSPLEHTGMLDFSHDKSRLFPIPLYRFWEDIGDEEAIEKFGKILEAELKQLYPTSDHEQISELYQVAMAGFEGE